MTASTLLEDLRQRGVTVSADGTQLRARPRQTVTDDDITAMREHKAELLTLLAVPPTLTVDPTNEGTVPYAINAVYAIMPVRRCNWPGCSEPVRLVRLHDGSEEQQCSSSHPQAWEPVTALQEPTDPLPLAPAGDEGERRVADYLDRGKPMLSCQRCQRDDWEQGVSGTWQCASCGHIRERARLVAWGEELAWPRLPLAHGTAIPGGEWPWRGTVRDASARSLAAIAAAVEAWIDSPPQRVDKTEDGRYPLVAAMVLADQLLAQLAPACERIAIAGSIRRRKASVKDIELVAIPKQIPSGDLFGDVMKSALDDLLEAEIAAGRLAWNVQHKGNGPRYKCLWLPDADLAVDLFLADVDNWGNQLVIRTGDGNFTKRLVTSSRFGGCMPDGLRQRDGYLCRGDERLPCPTEEAFFAAIGVSPVPTPEERSTR